MEPSPSFEYALLFLFLFVSVNGLFAAAEFAIINSRPSELRKTNERGKRFPGSATGLWLIEHLDLSLSAVQVGMTTSSILLGWLGIQALHSSLLVALGATGPEYPAMAAALLVLSILAVVFLHAVFGELIAKSIAIRYPETVLRLLSGPLLVFTQIARPLLFVATRFSNIFLRVFRTKIPETSDRLHSVSDISELLSEGTERGVFDKDEEKMIRGVFGFSETVAREVMTPRTDLVTIDIAADLQSVLHTVVTTGFSRFPVRGSGVDDALGILLVKDLLPLFQKFLSGKDVQFQVRRFMREAYFIPGTKSIDELLNEFKRRKLHMAIVLDEHGGVDGVVTLEDLIEEIVGDIYDESDELQQSVIVQANGDLLIDGGTLVSDLNERFSTTIPEGDYDTIAGFIYTTLGKVPKVGDSLYLNERGVTVPPAEEDGVVVSEELTNGNHPASSAELEAIQSSGSGEFKIVESEPDDRAEEPVSMLLVEKVQGHRIESVRIKHIYPSESSFPAVRPSLKSPMGIS